jgi:hypothetical protein
MTEIEIWTKWESKTVNGLYPLRRFLGRSNHSVVFLTECKAQNLSKAAIKLIPADPVAADAQLARWRSSATLTHPNLMRVLDTGRCQLGGHPFLFVVMEYADQTLAQILPHRPLILDEVRELLAPTLGALAYLHAKKLVQGQLKPPNFLVVNDQLKLASDTVRGAGECWPSAAKPSVYDPPEAATGVVQPAGDIWGLGITLVEALTQSPPAPTRDPSKTVSLPAELPVQFADALWRCLNRNPAMRPTVLELEAQFTPKLTAAAADPGAVVDPADAADPAAAVDPAGAAHPAVAPAPSGAAPDRQSAAAPMPPAPGLSVTNPAGRPSATGPVRTQSAPAARSATAVKAATAADRPGTRPPNLVRWIGPAVAVGLIVMLAIWAAAPTSGTRKPAPAAANTAQTTPQQSAPQTASSANSPASASAASAMIHQEIPVASRHALDSIHGQIKVEILVTVDRAGSVVAQNLENRASSRYFARLAGEAAKKWRFTPADTAAPRQWLLEFDFTRSGAAVQAAPRIRRPAS